MKLTKIERSSALWPKLKAHYEARLANLRAQNDTTMNAEQTATLRGRIAEVKGFLALGDDPNPEEVTDDA